MRNRLTVFTILLAITFCLTENIAQAQTRNSPSQEIDRSAGITGGFRFDLLGRARPGSRAGFALMPLSRVVNASSSITPMAVGSNLPVMGGGTLGRLTKWTGFTSSNSFISNSTIFEDKFGAVGIGTDTPTSRLTVAGLIESTIGGFKFPDGTIQTTSASGALFGVVHDATLVGNGTAGSPLGVAIPLVLSGAASGGIIQATNIGFGVGMRGESTSGTGVAGKGGDDVEGFQGGTGVEGTGGATIGGQGGHGIDGTGGEGIGEFGIGGFGVVGNGGFSTDSSGGGGVIGTGGSSKNASGGTGVQASGGDSSNGFGGNGLTASRGEGPLGDGLAGSFFGNVEVEGDLSVTGTKNFKIDHPLDPENKYLYHAAVESSEVLNIYSGNVITDQRGDAVVTLPDWFEALNKDPRYQLTVIGTFAQAIIASQIQDNRFTIKTNAPNVRVSWQVTGVRSDVGMSQRPFKAEQDKPERERGSYLNPQAYGQPEERGAEWARNPEMMRQMKDRRNEMKKQQRRNH